MQPSRAAFLMLATLLASAPLIRGDLHAQARSIDDFFSSFTAEWVRLNPNQGTASRYFTGPEQDALETQLTPATREWRHRRVELARRGVAELAAFERSRLSDTQRVSADLMTWQLAVVVGGEKYEDFTFPLEQFGGVNVSLPTQLTVVHPLITEKDAANYVARLGHVATRMEEATAEVVALGEKRLVPPRFIIGATIAQMEQFVSTPPSQNPFVAVFNDRMAAASGIDRWRLFPLGNCNPHGHPANGDGVHRMLCALVE